MQAHERALGRARSQRFRDNEKLKKINERCRKDRLPALTLKLMRGDAPGSSVPLATHSATEEAIVMRPTRRSSRWDVSHEYTEHVETEVKTEDSPERLTVSFTCHEDKGIDVEEGTSRPGSGTTLVMEAAKRSGTWCDRSACLSITLFRLSSIRRRVLSNTNHNGNANKQNFPIS